MTQYDHVLLKIVQKHWKLPKSHSKPDTFFRLWIDISKDIDNDICKGGAGISIGCDVVPGSHLYISLGMAQTATDSTAPPMPLYTTFLTPGTINSLYFADHELICHQYLVLVEASIQNKMSPPTRWNQVQICVILEREKSKFADCMIFDREELCTWYFNPTPTSTRKQIIDYIRTSQTRI